MISFAKAVVASNVARAVIKNSLLVIIFFPSVDLLCFNVFNAATINRLTGKIKIVPVTTSGVV